MSYVEYDSNNSGGSWWLKDKHWLALEEAGWIVDWIKDRHGEQFFKPDKNGRWLGALATDARLNNATLEQAIESFERITGQKAAAPGCRCCGQPHNFYERSDDGVLMRFGPGADYGFPQEDE